MSDPRCYVHISIYNKKLRDFLYKYAKEGVFSKDKLIMTSFINRNPKENLSLLCEERYENDYHINILDTSGGAVYHVPEGVYDVIPCFLIYLEFMYTWDEDVFSGFKTNLLKEQPEIQKYFDKVSWEVEWLDNRYSWDGIYKWEESFIYDRFSDVSEHVKKTYKLGLDLEERLNAEYRDEYEKERCKDAIIQRSKYHDYNWDELGKRQALGNFNDDFSDDLPDDLSDELLDDSDQ